MADRKVLCDECFIHRGITAVPMQKTTDLAVVGPMIELPLGDTYVCGCGRFYSERAGYFNFVQGQGMHNRRPVPRCYRSDCLEDPMYLKSVGKEGIGVFACPHCEHEREEKINLAG